MFSAAACGDEGGPAQPSTKKFKSGAGSGSAALKLESDAFKEGGEIPARHSCKGGNVPPTLTWSGIPSGTKDVALLVTDPKGQGGLFVHWIVTDLPNTPKGSITNGKLPSRAKVEPNSANQPGYAGMCPPAGQTHEYHFEILALNKEVTFRPNSTPADKARALRSAAFSSGRLVGEFTG